MDLLKNIARYTSFVGCKQTIPVKRLAVSLAVGLLMAGIARAETSDVVNSYIGAVNRIKSYDVTYTSEMLDIDSAWDGKDDEALSVDLTQTNREVFASDLGWRDERYVGDKDAHTIAVLDWKTWSQKVEAHLVLARGLGYSTWFNPALKGMYLKDWLTNQQTALELIPQKTDNGLRGLKVSNPNLPFHYIQIWLDSQHGYLPQRIDYFLFNKSKKMAMLSERVEIRNFFRIEEGTWAPSKIMRLVELPSGKVASGTRVILNLEDSKFNTALPRDLFLAAKLPEVNMKEDGGWECYYPPALLPSVKQAAAMVQAMESPRRIRPWILVALAGISLLGIVFIFIKVRKAQLHSTVA